MSAPPPLTMLVASPAPEPPMSEILSGVLKYSEMPFRSALVVEPSSHISRKNAIIAVTKSAYAIFQAPPWWPCPPFLMRLTMIGLWESSLIDMDELLALALLDFAFQLGERRALRRIKYFASELHRDLRGVAVQAREQSDLDALEHLAGLVELVFQQGGQRTDEAVREQDAQEGPDQRG